MHWLLLRTQSYGAGEFDKLEYSGVIAPESSTLMSFRARAGRFRKKLFDDSGELDPESAASLASDIGATLPYIAEMALAATHTGALGPCDDDAEFLLALDFILDGLDRLQSS